MAGCRPALNTFEEYVGMISRTHTGTFGTCGARTLRGEAYCATPLGGGLGFHRPTLDLPRCTAADHHLPKVPLNDGLSDDLHAVRTVTTFFEFVYVSIVGVFGEIGVHGGTHPDLIPPNRP